jgi:hypothetical protein
MKPQVLNAFKEVRKQMRKAQGKSSKPTKQQETPQKEETLSVKILNGTGKIMVSGTTVHGIGTRFLTEVKQNDFFIIRHDNIEEKQKVVLVISDKSALISESFQDERTSEYFIETLEKPSEPSPEPEKKKKIEKNSKIYEVRVKRGPWTYKVDKVSKSSEISNEDLLNVRTLRVRDKFCWM